MLLKSLTFVLLLCIVHDKHNCNQVVCFTVLRVLNTHVGQSLVHKRERERERERGRERERERERERLEAVSQL